MKEPTSLYVHIPFCHHLCSYCDFSKVLYEEGWCFSYLSALKKELERRLWKPRPLKTLYIGGGSPSALSLEELRVLFSMLEGYISTDTEVTFEANPEDLTSDKLTYLLSAGVNRLSLGIESSIEKYLRLMGRHHSFELAKEKIKLARRLGFRRISADLIYALPFESFEEVEKEVASFLSLGLDHYSAYTLSVSPGTRFHNEGIKEMDDENGARLYMRLTSLFQEAGYRRYEVSNFARNGDYSRHNLVYWHDEPYFAVGLGASGYLGKMRYTNTRNLHKYLDGNYEGESELLDRESLKHDFFLTGLRLEEGLNLSEYRKRFSEDFEKTYKDALTKLEKEGLVFLEGDRLKATEKGFLLLDLILLELF